MPDQTDKNETDKNETDKNETDRNETDKNETDQTLSALNIDLTEDMKEGLEERTRDLAIEQFKYILIEAFIYLLRHRESDLE